MLKLKSILAILFVLLVVQGVRADTINIAAAISMKETLTDANAAFMKETGDDVQFTFGASGVLLTQIKNGAPIDAFISAAADQVDALEKADLIVKGSRRLVATNELVLIVPAASELKISSIQDLTKPEVKKVAIGQPKSVPAGQYAAQTIAKLKLEEALSAKIVNGTNVRQVLDYVISGNVDAGFVYATDAAQAGGRVKVIATAPADSHDPIVYPGVLLAASKKPEVAQKFFNFLASPAGQKIIHDHGFTTETSPATLPAK